MRFITTKDITTWADTIDCHYHLPQLIRKLIVATLDSTNIKKIHFPYGEDAQTGGYDGELITECGNMFAPEGESVWEFGTTAAKKKQKADDDYNKRKLNTLGKNPSKNTYIAINGYKYRDKEEWCNTKKAEGFWEDVRYLDAIDIDQWLELAPTVELWLAERLGKPTLGIYSASVYWKRWSQSKSLIIPYELLLGESRQIAANGVEEFINNNEGILYIRSVTTDDALAFSLAALYKHDNYVWENVVVIDNREAFQRFIQLSKKMTIVVKFTIEGSDKKEALERGHKLLIPISLSVEPSGNKIQLPIISRDTFENALLSMGIDREQARSLTKNSGRSIAVLKRLLQFEDSVIPQYLDSKNNKNIVALLLINKFTEGRHGDREIIERLTGESYAEFSKWLRVLATTEDSPVYYLNGTWRLVSLTDACLYFAKYLTMEDLDTYRNSVIDILTEVHHKYTLPLEQRGNYLLTPENTTKYSSTVREGVCESLAVLSVYGSEYGINFLDVPLFVDGIVNEIFQKDINVWRTLGNNLMLLSEASPAIFLNNLERIIKDLSVEGFFEETPGFFNGGNDLAPLLWCLDIVAWMPDNLMRAASALCELMVIGPEKYPTSNTPISSLKNIFRFWYPQTNTNVEERKSVLNALIKKFPDIMYDLLVSLSNVGRDTAFQGPRPKWRLFSELREIDVSYQEMHYMLTFSIEKIIDLSKGDIQRILSLIGLMKDMNWNTIERILDAIPGFYDYDDESKKKVYNKFRKFIGNHRSHPTASWALPEAILGTMEKVALQFQPADILIRDSYLFEEHYPEFIEGRQGSDFKKHGEEIAARRLAYAENVISSLGINGILDSADHTEYPDIYGHVLGFSEKLTEEEKSTLYWLIDCPNEKRKAVASKFIAIRGFRDGLEEQIKILRQMMESGLSVHARVSFLNSLQENLALWKAIECLQQQEVEKLYWESRRGTVYTSDKIELMYALEKLNRYAMPLTLINTLSGGLYDSYNNEITSEEILSILEGLSLSKIEESAHFDVTNFSAIFNFLYAKNDYDLERGAQVETKFLFVFSTSGIYSPKPQNLFKIMAKKPFEYFEIIRLSYLPDDKELKDEEIKKIKDNSNHIELSKTCWNLLESFNIIPSMEDGKINYEELKSWITKVRDLGKTHFRARVTDEHIGQLLAKYPINMGEMIAFPEEIYDLLEELDSEWIRPSFRRQISNNLGMTTRAAFEGGTIERFRANYFNMLLEQTKFSHPYVSLIFKELRDKYLSEASWEDDNATLRSLS